MAAAERLQPQPAARDFTAERIRTTAQRTSFALWALTPEEVERKLWLAMRVRDLIVRLVALRDAGILDEWGSQLVGSLERQAARGQGPTERQRIAAVQLLKKHDLALTARAVAEHVAKLTPKAVERIHRDAQGREKDST